MLSVATEPHQVDWLREAAEAGQGRLLDTPGSEEMNSPTYLAGVYSPDTARSSIPPSWRSNSPAHAGRRRDIYERTNASRLDSGGLALRVDTGAATVTARQAVLATNVYPSLLRRNRLRTVPVYDYVLATEPLTDAQLARVGWQGRQGVGDCANQFHYYRLTVDNRIVWGGYDAVYHFGRKVDAAYEDRPAPIDGSPRTSSSRSPNSTTFGSPPVGGSHRHQHALLRALGFGPRRPGGICQRVHRARGGRGEVRRRRVSGPARGQPHRAHRAGDGPRASAAVPAGAVRQRRHPGDELVSGPRRSLGGTAQHLFAHARRARPGFDS